MTTLCLSLIQTDCKSFYSSILLCQPYNGLWYAPVPIVQPDVCLNEDNSWRKYKLFSFLNDSNCSTGLVPPSCLSSSSPCSTFQCSIPSVPCSHDPSAAIPSPRTSSIKTCAPYPYHEFLNVGNFRNSYLLSPLSNMFTPAGRICLNIVPYLQNAI